MPLPRLPHKENSPRQQSLFLTRTDWILAVVFVVVLVAQVPLVLVGDEFARRVLFLGCGTIVAFGLVDSTARLTGNRKRAGFLFLVAGGVGLALFFALPCEWSFELVGRRLSPDTERASVWFVYGFLGGLVGGAGKLLWGSSPRGEAREQRREWLREMWELMRAEVRTLAVVAGAVLGVFTLFFAAYVAFWYVLDPLACFFLE